jgi:CheY-like chemotaxis protein
LLDQKEQISVGENIISKQRASRILVVDDTQDAAQAMALLLELEGYRVAVAFGGLQAMETLPTFRPQIAVLDIAMPDMDGFTLVRRIRATPCGSTIHCIAFTGRSDEASRKRALLSGFHRYLVKPIEPQHFIELIGELELTQSIQLAVTAVQMHSS